MRTILAIMAVLAAQIQPCRAQSARDLPQFEVASVKPAPPDAAERSLTHKPGARLVTSNATLRMLILLGYQIMPFQIGGGPKWLSADGFDIDAKAADPAATPQQFRQMIQRLLAERFHLACHFETRQLPVYELIAAKSGPKLLEDRSPNPEVSMRNEGRQLVAVKAGMPMLAAALTRVLDHKVIDATGLRGAYTFTLPFTRDEKPVLADQPPSASADEPPPIATALREQLGLTLRPARGPVEILIIDNAEKPAAN